MTIKLALAPLLAVALALGACDPACRPAIRVRPVEATMPVAVSCVPKDAPIAPSFPDDPKALLAAPDMSARDQLLRQGYPMRLEWERLASRLLAACAGSKP
ncbi:MAG: hypothetical protein ACREEW_06200 [Caulobacteraceae bacterium]